MQTFEFTEWDSRCGDRAVAEAWRHDRSHDTQQPWQSYEGRCQLCELPVRFVLAVGADPEAPVLREQVICPHCGCNARVRAALGLLRDSSPPGGRRTIYVTEQATPTYVWMQRNMEAEVIGSEYEIDPDARVRMGLNLAGIGGDGDIRFEDVTGLSFADNTIDAIVSFDVLEHVPDYGAALAEFARVLKPGGVCVATFPFTDGPETVVRARLDANGAIEHLLEPEYHGDPISGGVLCFYHFGWDLLARIRAAGFTSVRMVMPWAPGDGLAYGLWTLLATR